MLIVSFPLRFRLLTADFWHTGRDRWHSQIASRWIHLFLLGGSFVIQIRHVSCQVHLQAGDEDDSAHSLIADYEKKQERMIAVRNAPICVRRSAGVRVGAAES